MNKIISKAKPVLKKAGTELAKVRSKINFKKISSIAISVILVLLIALVGFLLVVRMSGGVPKLAGYMVLRVSSASMEPELKVGDIILTQEVKDVSQLKKGDIITYNGEVGSYADKLITHQVEVSPYMDDGEYRLVTRGIAVDFDDPIISAHQVEGKMICKLTILSVAYDFFKTPWGLVSAILLIILLFAGEMWNIIKMPVDNKQEKSEDDSQQSEHDSDENSESEPDAQIEFENEIETQKILEKSDKTADEQSSEQNSDESADEVSENDTDEDNVNETSEISAEHGDNDEKAEDDEVEAEKQNKNSDTTSESTEQKTSENE